MYLRDKAAPSVSSDMARVKLVGDHNQLIATINPFESTLVQRWT